MTQYGKILWVVAAVALASCTDRLDRAAEGARIGLRADIDGVEVSTRATANPYEGTTPSSSNVLDASVWISKSSGVFANTGTPGNLATLPLHTEFQFNSSGLVYPLSDVLLYPESETVYCVGLYPYSASAWVNEDAFGTADNTKASHVINGSDDLMFAPQVSGTKASPISSSLDFTHQLTWLKINVIAEDADAISSWGNVTDITVTSPGNKLTVDLSAGTASCNATSTDITAFDSSAALKITSQQFGSIFCAPATGYNIKVTTANSGGVKDLGSVALKQEDGETNIPNVAYAKGKMFVITLNFKNVYKIEATCTLTAWDDTFQTIQGPVVNPS